MEALKEDLVRQLKYAPRAIILFGIIVFAFLFFRENDKNQIKTKLKELFKNYRVVLFLLWVSFVLTSTIFSRWFQNPYRVVLGGFGFITSAGWNTDTFENIALFIPYTFLYIWAFKLQKSWKAALKLSLISTISIELLQFIFWLGSFQFSDIVHNVEGGMLGCGLWYTVKLIVNQKTVRANYKEIAGKGAEKSQMDSFKREEQRMNKNYDDIPPNTEIVFHYSDLFEGEIPDLDEQISKLNVHKTISIICELIQTTTYKIPMKMPFVGECTLPYECALKAMLNPPSSPEDMRTKTWYFRKDIHIYCTQYLLILLKIIIAKGDLLTLDETDYEITANDYRDVLTLCLLIGERQHKKFSDDMSSDEMSHFVYGNYHLNNNTSIGSAYVRTYYIFEKLSKHPDMLEEDVRKEYKDYYNAFLKKYGFTVTDYIISLMWEFRGYSTPESSLLYQSIWKNVHQQYSSTPCEELEQKVIGSIARPVEEYRNWALETLDEDWDFQEFLSYPFLMDDRGNYISVSDYTLKNALFFNVYWMVRACYPEEDKRAMAFYGRLYEKYLQDITYAAISNSEVVKYVAEKKYFVGRNERRSSDAYIQQDDKLIAIEMKGYSILIDSLTKGERITDNNKKLFVSPVSQTCDRFKELRDIGEFGEISILYVISVTMDSITMVPEYINKAKQEIFSKDKTGKLVDCFNFSVAEYEIMLSLIEQGVDPFVLIEDYRSKVASNPLHMFQTYVHENYNQTGMHTGMTKLMDKTFEEVKAAIYYQFGIGLKM